jgi:hypothetical protein
MFVLVGRRACAFEAVIRDGCPNHALLLQVLPAHQNAAKIHCLMLFPGQNHFALEPFSRDLQVRPAIDLAMG